MVIAILLMVLGLLLLTNGKTEVELTQERFTTTKTRLQAINRAMTIFYEKNNYFPCPANNTLAPSDASFGKQNGTAGACNGTAVGGDVYIGGVPTRDLGLADKYSYDEWGNRFTFARSANAAIRVNDSANNAIEYTPSGGNATTSVNVITLSHGKDGIGAYNRGGTLIPCTKNGTSATLSELQNCDRTNETFYYNIWDSSSSGYYDDLISVNAQAAVPCEDSVDYPEQSNLVAWYDASDVNGTGSNPADGSTVATWVDKANGRNLTTTGSPTFESDGASTINSHPVIRFSSGKTAATAAADWGNEFTIFLVNKTTSHATSTWQQLIKFHDNYFFKFWTYAQANVYHGYKTGLFYLPGNAYTYTASFLYNLNETILNTFKYENKNFKAFKNGAKVIDYTIAGNPTIGCTSGGTPSTCPLTLSDSSYAYTGDYAEILVYNKPLTASCQKVVECKLAKKWGLVTQESCVKDDGVTPIKDLDGNDIASSSIPQCPAVSSTTCPANIPGCVIWLNAQENTSLLKANGSNPANGDAVAKWCDVSGNNHNGVATYSPVLATNGMGSGKAAINFSAASQVTSGNFTLDMQGAGRDYSTFFALMSTAIPNDTIYLRWYDVGSYSGGMYPAVSLHMNYYSFQPIVHGSALYTPDYTWTGSKNYIISIISNNTANPRTIDIYMNGTRIASYDSNTYSMYPYIIDDRTGDVLGAYLYAAGKSSYIGEFSKFSSALNDVSRKKIEKEMGDRWGVKMPHTDTVCPNSAYCPSGSPVCPDGATPTCSGGGTMSCSGTYAFCPAGQSPQCNVTCPGGIAGCKVWLDAQDSNYLIKSDNTSATSDDDVVYTWCDKSANNNFANQVYQPKLNIDAFGTGYNGIDVNYTYGGNWNFNGLVTNWISGITKAGGSTVFVTFRSPGAMYTTNYILHNPTNWSYQLAAYYSGGQMYAYPGNTGLVTTYNVFRSNQSYIFTLWSDGTTAKLYANGVLIAQAPAQSYLYNFLGTTIGAMTSGSSNSMNIGSYAVYASALNDSDRRAVENTMAANIGITKLAYNLTCPSATTPPWGSIPGLKVWYDAQDATTLKTSADADATNGATIAGICDKSGNNNRSTPVGTVTYTSDAFGSGKNGINIGGGNLLSNYAGLGQSVSKFLVFKNTNAGQYPPNNTVYLLDSYSYYNNIGLSMNYNWQLSPAGRYTTNMLTPNYLVKDNQNYLVSIVNDTTTDITKAYLNGNQIYSSSGYDLLDYNGESIGGYTNGFYIGEYAAFSSALSDNNRKAVEKAIGDKWGITTNVDITCPATSSCPANIAGCKYWFDAQDSATTIKANNTQAGDGEVVNTWCDKSGNNNHTIKIGDPTLSTTAFGGSKRGIYTWKSGTPAPNQTNSMLVDYENLGTNFTNTVALQFVAPSTSGIYGAIMDSWSYHSALSSYYNSGYTDLTLLQSFGGGGTWDYTTGIPASGANAIITTQVNGTNSSMWADGNLIYTGTYYAINGAYANEATLLGGYSHTYFGEAAHYASILSTNDRKAIECEMATNQNICSVLPASYCTGITNPTDPQSDDFCCDTTASSNACAAVCGDSIIGVGETCDDGNTNSCDGCNASCQTEDAAVCGNSVLECGETCDDGNATDNDGCSASCQTEICGDSIVNNVTETCDDGNQNTCDGCDASCQIEASATCGNWVQECGETCDDGNQNNGDGCNSSCILEYCGDGIVNNNWETCDDGNTSDGDYCTSACQNPYCGDGHISAGESCDDGNQNSADGCSSSCQAEACSGDCSGMGCGYYWDTNSCSCVSTSSPYCYGGYYDSASCYCVCPGGTSYDYGSDTCVSVCGPSEYWTGYSCQGCYHGSWNGSYCSCDMNWSGSDCNSCSYSCSYGTPNASCDGCDDNMGCSASGGSWQGGYSGCSCPGPTLTGGPGYACYCMNSCQNGGTQNSAPDCSCNCPSGYSGTYCESYNGYCGDGGCNNGEGTTSCPQDCGSSCGDGYCNQTGYGSYEDCGSCSSDCGYCGPSCGNYMCESGEDYWNCSSDCSYPGPVCGSYGCESGEDQYNCPTDCGSPPYCGDGSCNNGEDCSSCSGDCGPCPYCGDGSCNNAEDSGSCCSDCGGCGGGDPTGCNYDPSCQCTYQGSGYYWNGSCQYDATGCNGDSACQCTAQGYGYYWNGGCSYDGTGCYGDPYCQCAQSGGTYDGMSCNY